MVTLILDRIEYFFQHNIFNHGDVQISLKIKGFVNKLNS